MGCGSAKEAPKQPSKPQNVEKIPEAETKPSKESSSKKNSDNDKGISESKRSSLVLGKYTMKMGKEDLMGEGTSSICRRGTDVKSNQVVAIKVYKTSKDGPKSEEVKLQKFKRQVQVLRELQEPFIVPQDPTLWSDELEKAKPTRLFMALIDYSKDASGQPGLDPTDKTFYIVSELAHYSLKDYLSLRRDQQRPLPKESVRNITKAIMLVVAGLHAKGLVHIDLKPENLMLFDGRLKLIDVDGCVKIGTPVSINDSSISFSPCYCAPEWAKFLIEDSEQKIQVIPSLDVWSVGMTICELVTLDAVLKPMYANFLRNGHSHREAGFLFMEWLSGVKRAPLPKSIENYPDADFGKLLKECLLVTDHKKRKSLAMSLSHPFVANATSSVAKKEAEQGESSVQLDMKDEKVERRQEMSAEDTASIAVVCFKGTLWILNNGASPQDPQEWLQQDTWIAGNGSVCYFSIKDNKRMVLFDGKRLQDAQFRTLEGVARQNAFELSIPTDSEDGSLRKFFFAAASGTEKDEWLNRLKEISTMDALPKFRLGDNFAQEVQTFRLNVKNRRMKVEEKSKELYEPVFKAILWKVKAEGDRMKDDDWFEREMWLSRNGSLVYWSKKEERDLVYYTNEDLSRATYKRLEASASAKPWSFQIWLAKNNDVEFAPGEFAAESEAMRNTWLEEFEKLVVK